MPVDDAVEAGASGLWDDLHRDLTAELARRDNGLRITSNPTRVLAIDFPGAAAGVALKYRAHARIAEIAIGKAFKGSRVLLQRMAEPDFVTVTSGGELFVRLPDWERSELQSPSDIADALESLWIWWMTRGHLSGSQVTP